MASSPHSEPHDWCLRATGKQPFRENLSSIEEVFERYFCDFCDYQKPHKLMRWACLAASEMVDSHPGYGSFEHMLDFAILHLHEIISTSTFYDHYVLPNGVELTKFIATPNGILSNASAQHPGPGTHVVYIPGMSRHTGAILVRNKGEWCEYPALNDKYSGLKATYAGFIYLLNPNQKVSLGCGKLFFDLNPTVIPKWLPTFVNNWTEFISRNPQANITEIYRADGSVWYGTPGQQNAFVLDSYHGLPLLLGHYRGRLGRILCQILVMGQLKMNDKLTVYPGTSFSAFI